VITARRTRLVRVPDLHAFRQVVVSLSQDSPAAPDRRLVIVATRSAARLIPDVREAVTRDDLYQALSSRLSPPVRLLSAVERHCLMHAAAAGYTDGVPFRLRPGLVAEMVRFYDQLRRQSQGVTRFEELLQEALGEAPPEIDRGAERLRRQTRFLADSFRAYERRVEGSGGHDEHTLRARLLTVALHPALEHVIVTVPDWIADPDGLFVADFDVLSQMPGLAALDVVCTAAVLESGFHERLHQWWPGIEERGAGDICEVIESDRPRLMVPAGAGDPWFTWRDREEELLAIARRIGPESDTPASPLDRTAVVFKRPLPYLYIAPDALGGSGIPFQSSDALPLAAEPVAAAVDLVLECAESDFIRAALVALLGSPYFRFTADDVPVSAAALAAFDRALAAARYLGELSRLEALAADPAAIVAPEAAGPLSAAVAIGRELAALQSPAPASQQLDRLIRFLAAHGVPPENRRERRASAAIHDTLVRLRDAHAAHHDPAWTIVDLAVAVRRWIEEQTFAPETTGAGIHLVDDQTARYGDYDDIMFVGLVEHEWPERPVRNIFYPASVLKILGWPSERDRHAASDARFLDLLRSARRSVGLSTFTLEDESLVMRSMQLDEIARAGLSTSPLAALDRAPVHRDDRLARDAPGHSGTGVRAREWLELRTSRTGPGSPLFHGSVGARPPRPWSVSALETYLECPFKFFARHVLRLQEELDDEEVMDPRREGRFVHEVFEAFFTDWQASGRGAITPLNLDEARALFTVVVDRLLAAVPPSEAGLARTRLLGSPAAAGLGEAVLRMEAERQTEVVERLLEHDLSGEFAIDSGDGSRRVALRGKADRLDLLADGTFRLIDYKLGWPPNRSRALQLPVYGVTAEQALRGRRGRTWTLGEAVYLAFKGPRRVVPLFTAPEERATVLAGAQQRLADTLAAIERGAFPPAPDDVWRCETCSFSAVCRKDYVGDV
jgi:RecB family exonuclease